MPKKLICKICKNDVNILTKKGLCMDCTLKRVHQNIMDLKSKKGKYYTKYKKGLLNYITKKE